MTHKFQVTNPQTKNQIVFLAFTNVLNAKIVKLAQNVMKKQEYSTLKKKYATVKIIHSMMTFHH